MIEKSRYFSYLMPSPEDEVIERDNDFYWFDDSGILCTVPKEEPKEVTMAQVKKEVIEWEKERPNEKYCMVTVVNPKAKSTKEQRDYIAEIFPKFTIALAVINDSALGRMAINLFIGLKPPTYPLKVFKTSEEAKDWLKEYL